MNPFIAFGAGNSTIESFTVAKKLLEEEVYHDHRVTVYCAAEFDDDKRICLPDGFVTPKHEKRAEQMEWEHIVPAENFGRSFVAWPREILFALLKVVNPIEGEGVQVK